MLFKKKNTGERKKERKQSQQLSSGQNFVSLEDIRWFLEAEAVVKPGTLGWGCGSEAKQITALLSREALGWCPSATHEETTPRSKP